MSRNRRSGGGGAVRGPASALTSFLAGLGVEPPTRLTTWDTTISDPTVDAQSSTPASTDPAGIVTARNVVAGPSQVGEGTPVSEEEQQQDRTMRERDASEAGPSKRQRKQRGTSVDSDDLDAEWVDKRDSSSAPSPVGEAHVAPEPLRAVGEFMICGECNKRFTVTGYTKEHPSKPSVWICVNCCFIVGIDPFAKPKKAAKPKVAKKDTRTQIVHYEARKGSRPLSELCIKLIGQYIEDVEQLGDIGSINMDKVCKIISKSRRLTPETALLFCSVERTNLALYDCTRLIPESYMTLADLCPNITDLHLHLCGQLSTNAVSYWAKNLKKLRRVELFAPFLVRKQGWLDLFSALGKQLQGLLVTQSPRIDREILDALVICCPHIQELRLSEIGLLSDDLVKPLEQLKELTYLDLSSPGSPVSDDAIIDLLEAVGKNLVHLDLSDNHDLTDSFLPAIVTHCPNLRQLILRNLTELSDKGVSNFFSALKKADRHGYEVIDLEKGHDLKGDALKSLIAHSGDSLEKLSLLGWREVDEVALGGLSKCRSLRELNLGWCRQVTDFTVKEVLDSCDQVEVIRVWGCNQLTDAVPRKKGVKVIGIETHSI